MDRTETVQTIAGADANKIADMLASLNGIAKRAVASRREADAEAVMLKARAMARRGYCFNRTTLDMLKDYLSGYSIVVSGNVGTGKTFFFLCAGIKAALNMKIAEAWNLSDLGRALESYEDEPMLVDDIGAESREYSSYGTSTGLLEHVIEYRTRTGAPTYYTTNLSSSEIVARYGNRVADRICANAKAYQLTGTSHRGTTMPPLRGGARFTDFIKGRPWSMCAERCKFYNEMARLCQKGVQSEPYSCERCMYF